LADLLPFRAEEGLQSYIFSGGSGRDAIYQKQASEVFVDEWFQLRRVHIESRDTFLTVEHACPRPEMTSHASPVFVAKRDNITFGGKSVTNSGTMAGNCGQKPQNLFCCFQWTSNLLLCILVNPVAKIRSGVLFIMWGQSLVEVWEETFSFCVSFSGLLLK
jgi:hypothetical protein